MQTILGTMTFSAQVNQTVAIQMVTEFKANGHTELDTAFVYQNGGTERLLGDLNRKGQLDNCFLAGKVNPNDGRGLGAASIAEQLNTSLERLGANSVDLLYLHMPDLETPIATTLEAIQTHYQAGKFKRLGLSNYAAWQVAEVAELCRKNDWVEPSVYQGMYNALTRDVERELFSCLENYNISFYAFNPLAGGLLTGKYQSVDTNPESGRFATFEGYPERYWKPDYFAVVSAFKEACQSADIKPAAAAIRWLVHHSNLIDDDTHGIILGASSMEQFRENLLACEEGPLSQNVLDSLDAGWDVVRPNCMKYFRP